MAKSTAKKKATANLVIMESPSKANTVKGISWFGVSCGCQQRSYRDLPKSTLGVDIENHFQARYINIRGKGPLIRELKKEAKAADRVYLATDPDREGEAIAWHLAAALDLDENKTRRITFNEVTKTCCKGCHQAPACHRYEFGQQSAGAPYFGPDRRVQAQPVFVEDGEERSVCRTCAICRHPCHC